jgi:GMP synthase (glutamine-hydrolysing)
MRHEKILILDFGSQYTQLIGRRVRELGVFSEIRPCTEDFSAELLKGCVAVILSGGPASVLDHTAQKFDSRWLECRLPILGICYGMQLLAKHFGGSLESGSKREYGRADIVIQQSSELFPSLSAGSKAMVWMSHGDHVEQLPPGFELLASSETASVAAMGDTHRQIFGLQFHPEVVHTEIGKELLKAFVFEIAKAKGDWKPANFIEESIVEIQKRVGPTGNVICGMSGGVDSAVAAVLVHKAIGDRQHCILVDNGLMRHEEAAQIEQRLGKSGYGLNLTVIDARDRFLTALAGVSDPEQKRKIIGRVFIEVFEEEATRVTDAHFLVQGTLYPDVIESVSAFGPSHTIKSHHNVGGLPERMNLKLLEPFRLLFKDEVRRIGSELGMPLEIIKRQPFPGPGLAVRMLGDVTEAGLTMLRQADHIFKQEIVKADYYDKLWQSFAVLLPVRSVGVMGDGRTYEQTIALRAVHSDDGMTADWAYLPHDLLKRVSNRIINEVKGVNRVVLDISSKPPATIEWE